MELISVDIYLNLFSRTLISCIIKLDFPVHYFHQIALILEHVPFGQFVVSSMESSLMTPGPCGRAFHVESLSSCENE